MDKAWRLAVFGLGITEIIIVLVVALLVLGPKRLPDAARSLGRGLAEFRRASNEIRNSLSLEETLREPPRRGPESRPTRREPSPPAAPAPASTPEPRPADGPAPTVGEVEKVGDVDKAGDAKKDGD